MLCSDNLQTCGITELILLLKRVFVLNPMMRRSSASPSYVLWTFICHGTYMLLACLFCIWHFGTVYANSEFCRVRSSDARLSSMSCSPIGVGGFGHATSVTTKQ
jgi:hypothetical protein